MATDIDLRDSKLRFGQIKKELECIICSAKDLKRKYVNLRRIICELRSMEMISQEEQKALNEIHQNKNISEAEFIMKLLGMLSFGNLCIILDRVGLNTVVFKLQETRYTSVHQKPHNRELPYVKFIHEYNKTMKSNIDNGCFGGKQGVRNLLHNRLDNHDVTISSNNSTQNERQLALEQKAVDLFLLMQQYMDPEKRTTILTQALNTKTNGCDNTSLLIVIHSKLAYTEILRGNNDAAKEYFTQTLALCENISPSFALMAALHDVSLAQRVFWSNEQSEGISETAMTGGENALLCIFEEKEEVQNMWKRIILQYMVMSLLKMNIDFKVQTNAITKVNVARAKQLLHVIDKYSQDIEERRHMIKCICYGVVCEMEGDLINAQAYLREAVDIARDGGCFHSTELRNIEEYYADLSVQMSRK